MQKAFNLQPHETQQSQQLEAERLDLLAQLGAMKLEDERIRARLPQVVEEQRKLVRGTVQRLGIERYNSAIFREGNVIVDVPDEPPAPPAGNEPAPPAPDAASQHTNGAAKQ